MLVIEADTGKVLYAQNAGYPWYPASVTVDDCLRDPACREGGRITLDQPLTVSANAVAVPGEEGSRWNAGHGRQCPEDDDGQIGERYRRRWPKVGGSIEGFADLMNWHARHLGMAQSTFYPNGLPPADDQVSSARDLAILARALIREFPEYDYYWHLPGIRMGKMVQRNYNTRLGRYPGADGMKTGFICAAGFNLVASATRNGKRLIAVVLGAPSSAVRALKAAQLNGLQQYGRTGLADAVPGNRRDDTGSRSSRPTCATRCARAPQPATEDETTLRRQMPT